MNLPAAGGFNERSKMMSEACLTAGRSEDRRRKLKRIKTPSRIKKHEQMLMLDVFF
jgi:hypothetical protein